MVEYSLFIGGDKVRASSSERLERRNPATRAFVASYPCATEVDVKCAVATAKAALDGPWLNMCPSERSALLIRGADALEAAAGRLAEILALEVGKSEEQALTEVREGCSLWRYAAASLRSLRGEFYPALSADTQGQTFFEPV